MLLRADEDNDDVIESFSLYYIFSVFPSFVYYYIHKFEFLNFHFSRLCEHFRQLREKYRLK